jgi:HEAT repeat protein
VNALNDTIPLVRKAATVSTGQLKLTSAVGRLVHLLGDSFYGVRMTAFASLVQLDTQQVLKSIVDSLDSDNRLVGDLGCSLLGQLKTDSAKHTLLAQTRSGDPERRAHAAVALILADPTDECDFRESFLAAETDRFTRLQVESAISVVTNEQSAKSQ